MLFLWLILILYSKYLFNQHADENSNTRFGLINMNNSNHRSLWFNHSKTVECHFRCLGSRIRSLWSHCLVCLCVYTHVILSIYSTPQKNRWFPENTSMIRISQAKSRSLLPCDPHLGTASDLGRRGPPGSVKSCRMMIRWPSLWWISGSTRSHGTHGTHGSGKDSYTLW